MAEILQKQWSANVGVQVNFAIMDWMVWVQSLHAGANRGMTEVGSGANYTDPADFFAGFNGRDDGSGWGDREFRRLVDQAKVESDTAARMRKLAASEAYLLRSMPRFKYAWIDTKWRPS
jgi:ABC-type oligopeptide transport system substrate-binding subunit